MTPEQAVQAAVDAQKSVVQSENKLVADRHLRNEAFLRAINVGVSKNKLSNETGLSREQIRRIEETLKEDAREH